MNILRDKPWETLGAMRCDPISAALVGTAAASAAGGAAATAATAGLIGAGGAITAGGALTALGGLASIVGTLSSANAAQGQADYQSKVAQQNANTVAQQTAANAEAQDRQNRLRRGANIAAAGASGVGTDSFGDILQNNAALEQLDMLTIQSEGLLQQRNFESEASLATARGKSARTSGYIGAASSILGGASNLNLGGGGGISSNNLLKAPTGSPSGFSVGRI
jgi:hypothetical protein